jgi:hypothetical protein
MEKCPVCNRKIKNKRQGICKCKCGYTEITAHCKEVRNPEKPILFNTEMVQAILKLIKRSTRRPIKGYIPDDATWGYTMFTPEHCISCRGTFDSGYGEKFFKLPCEKGDILWVRETFCPNYFDNTFKNRNAYKADYNKAQIGDIVPEPKWNPSIHMPRAAARIFLKVTDVRIERLQDITEDGAKAEGITYPIADASLNVVKDGYKLRFSDLWNDLYKNWDENPWVWVVEFRKVEVGK